MEQYEWVSLEERLPTADDMVVDMNGYHSILVADKDGWDIVGFTTPERTLLEITQYREEYRVTHWMRLPALPETEQEDDGKNAKS